MRFRLLFIAVAVLVLGAAPARAQVFVGPNIDLSHWSFPKNEQDFSGTVFSVGGLYLSPGVRLGYLFLDRRLAATVDNGIQMESLGDITYNNLIVEPGLAYAFMPLNTVSPYVGISYGWFHQNLFEGLTREVIGASAGLRYEISAGHGFVRGELREDHFMNGDTNGLLLPDDIFGVRLGFDLLITK